MEAYLHPYSQILSLLEKTPPPVLLHYTNQLDCSLHSTPSLSSEYLTTTTDLDLDQINLRTPTPTPGSRTHSLTPSLPHPPAE